jgi:hypothetical protein
MATVFESRFARFEGPSSWAVAPGIGLVDADGRGIYRSALVNESWIDPPLSAAEYAARQRELVIESSPRTELVQERTLASPRLSDAHLGIFRTPGNDGVILQKQLTAVEGPLVCCLTVSGIEAEADQWEADGDQMLGTFEVTARKWALEIRREDLAAVGSSDEQARGDAELGDLGLRVPVAAGWQVRGSELHGSDGSTIRVQRSGLAGGSAEECFAEALQRLGRDPQLRPEAWAQKTSRSGLKLFWVRAAATTPKSWGPPQRRVREELYTDDEGVLAFVLDSDGDTAAASESLAEVVAGYCWLKPEERRLQMGEPWVPAVLEGPWIPAAPGVYAHGGVPRCLVVVQRFPRAQGLGKLTEAQIASARGSGEVREIVAEETNTGVFKGREATRYALDFVDPEGKKVSLRLVWIDGQEPARYLVMVRGDEPAHVDRVLAQLLDSFEPEGASGSERRGP